MQCVSFFLSVQCRGGWPVKNHAVIDDGAKMVALRVDVTGRSDTLTTARPVNTGSYDLVRLGDAASNGLKIRCLLTKSAELRNGKQGPLKVQ